MSLDRRIAMEMFGVVLDEASALAVGIAAGRGP